MKKRWIFLARLFLILILINGCAFTQKNSSLSEKKIYEYHIKYKHNKFDESDAKMRRRWVEVRRFNTIFDYENFIKEYPDSEFVEEARYQILLQTIP